MSGISKGGQIEKLYLSENIGNVPNLTVKVEVSESKKSCYF